MNFSKLLFTLLAFLFIVVVKTNGQNVIATTSEINYIDAIGSADTLITPDKIFIEITVRERYEGRTKVTIDSLEDLLKSTLIKIGMELKNLTLADANGDLVRIKWKKQDVLTSKNYSLMVSSASEVSKVYEELSKLKIQELSIEKVEHSKIEEFKKLIKIKAVQDSKDKATYMLVAIGNSIGKTIRIEERAVDSFVNSGFQSGTGAFLNIRGSRSEGNSYYVDGLKTEDNDIKFSKIPVSCKINGRFEIK
ncbi:MAG: SIMPL domain-containing protein [Bacteroidetes bacterium]|jgi:hypothetical protein|nr:SIMPL domain-containing protein [Bacteroidota bacterium]MBK9415515.1 SIMPL domain-containing protein [Bacteroidota bacterium]